MSDHRLPRSVLPRHYAIELAPDLDAAAFAGVVTVNVEVIEVTDVVVLNAAELAITSAAIVDADGSVFEPRVELDDVAERLVLRLDEPLPIGDAEVRLTFTGILNDKLRGFYRSTFVDDGGTEHTIATTQFESTNARRAFPCWDEPDMKATFGVTLVIDPSLMAVSSGAEVARRPLDDGRVEIRFADTMILSTYLLAFIVGPLTATDPVDVDGVALRIVHPIGKGHLTSFALEIGEFSLRHFTEYFGIAYPSDKLDLVAVPDFAFGAMENMGCATFREALLLVDPDTAPQPDQQRAADVIAHEIAHMWFGDLVTMSWWNGIWLKEAFATFCEMHTTDAWRPEWERWVDFGLSRTAAFDVDALSSTRPIEFTVESPDEAEAMYDVLTYEKGAAVVRMLEQYLGEERFRDGIAHYLAANAYGNTDTTDLWDALEATTGEPVRAIMDSWIFSGGHPLVTVETEAAGDSVRLTQQRFRYGGAGDEQWMVPMLVAGGNAAGRTITPLLLEQSSVSVPIAEDTAWIVPNASASGFFRTRYLGDLRSGLLASLDQLEPVERYGLVDDSWALLVAEQASLADLTEVIDAVTRTETDVSVWRRLGAALSTLDHHLDTAAREEHRRWSQRLVGAAFGRIGTDRSNDDGPRTQELRGVLLGIGGSLGDEDLIAQARALHPDPADPDRNAAAVRVIAKTGSAADFADFVERYEHARTPQDERRYLMALPSFPGRPEIDRLLDMIEQAQVRSQDAAFVLGTALGHRDHGAAVWSWVRDNWGIVNDRYPSNSIPRLISGIANIDEPTLAAEITTFFATNPVPQAGKSLDQSLERMSLAVALRDRLRRGAT